MGLNIKNEETCALVKELAELTGETKTRAITIAIRERLERERRKHDRNIESKLQEMRTISKRIAALMGPGSSQDHGKELYDEDGLPY